MILRKPYAFLIKRFRLFHLIVSGLLVYMIYRLNLLRGIVNEYLADITIVNNVDLVNDYFNIYMFIIPFVIIIFSTIIYSIMYLKKKPRLFYAISIIASIAILIILNYVYGNFEVMQNNIVNVRIVSLIRDFITIGLVVMGGLLVIFVVRATGFDIKKFNFGQDLQELEITEEDNEEFEVNVEFDSNEINRGIRRRMRFARYVYVENKFLINIVLAVVFIIVSFFIYLKITTMDTIYKQKDVFSSTNFIMHIDNSYVTTKDYKGNIITDNMLLVVDLRIRGKGLKEMKFDTYSLSIDVNGKSYSPIIKYKEKLIDLGINYIDQTIKKEDTNYILVFEIPKTNNFSNIIMKYVDKINYSGNSLKPEYVKVKIQPSNLDSVNQLKEFELGDTIEFDIVGLNGGKFTINSYELQESFKVPYRFCVTTNECYTSYEYIKPNIINNYDKVILKVDGEVINSTNNFGNLYDYIYNFGTLQYTINNKTKTQKVVFKEVKPTKFKSPNNIFYIEVLKEVMSSEKINLQVNVRGKIYSYKLK